MKDDYNSVDELKKALEDDDMSKSTINALEGKPKEMTFGRYLLSWVQPSDWANWRKSEGPYYSKPSKPPR